MKNILILVRVKHAIRHKGLLLLYDKNLLGDLNVIRMRRMEF